MFRRFDVRSSCCRFILVLAVIFCLAGTAHSFSPETDQSRSVSVEFDNGDTGRISCNKSREKCHVAVRVYGTRYQFTDAHSSLLASVIPDYFELVRLEQGDFGLGLHLWCPKEMMETHADVECYVNMTVHGGSPPN